MLVTVPAGVLPCYQTLCPPPAALLGAAAHRPLDGRCCGEDASIICTLWATQPPSAACKVFLRSNSWQSRCVGCCDAVSRQAPPCLCSRVGCAGCVALQEWRDAYSLYTVLTVVAMLAGQHSPQHMPGQQQQELLQDTQPLFTAVPAGNAHAAVPMAGAAAAGTNADAPTGGGDVPASSAAAIASAAGQQPCGQESSRAAAAAAAAPTSCSRDATATQQLLCEGLRQLDMAALMGGPRFRPWVDRLIDVLDSRVQELQANHGSGDSTLNPGAKTAMGNGRGAAQRANRPLPFSSSKRKAEDSEGMLQPGSDHHTQEGPAADAASAGVMPLEAGRRQKQHKPTPGQPQHQQEQRAARADQSGQQAAVPGVPTGAAAAQVTLPPGSLTNASAVVHLEDAPSMEHFLVECLLAEGR
jgi:hypothetical protein